MSRPLKFRAWDKDREEMFDVDIINFVTRTVEGISQYKNITQLPFDGVILMQYTGLKDENGKEIYEGDLFGVRNLSDELEIVGEVIFDTDFAQFTIKYTNGGWAELWQHLSQKTNKAKEVIGNIYENQELLEGEPNE